jgi:Flp pilus assembly pilin Flp
MQNLLVRFWNDDEGALIAVEWLFFVTIMIIGLVVGLKTVQGSINNEFEEIASAIGALSQSYSFSGARSCESVDPVTGRRTSCASSNGSSFTDRVSSYNVDVCVDQTDTVGVVCPD